MNKIIKKLLPKVYWSVCEEYLQSFFRNEFEMQQLEKKYPQVSHGLQIYEDELGKAWRVVIKFYD